MTDTDRINWIDTYGVTIRGSVRPYVRTQIEWKAGAIGACLLYDGSDDIRGAIDKAAERLEHHIATFPR